MRMNVKLQFLLVAGVSALLGYAAAHGRLNPFAKANAGPTEPARAAAPEGPAAAATPVKSPCCSDDLSKGDLVAKALNHQASGVRWRSY